MSVQLDIQVADSRPFETGFVPMLVSVLNPELEIVTGPIPFLRSQGAAIQVDPGTYVIHLDTPSGQRFSKAVAAREGQSQRVLFDLHALSGHEALAKTTQLQPFDRQEQSLGLDADQYCAAWVKLWKRQTTGQWLLSRFVPLATEHDREGVRYDFSLPTGSHVFQIGGPKIIWRLFALPVHQSVTVTIAPDQTRSGEVATTAVAGNEVAESLLGYLSLGLTAHAAALWPMAENLLQHKFRDPIGAAVGGYFLLRLRRFRRLQDWAANLANNFEWLPDGAIIDGWLHLHMARENDDNGEYILARNRLMDAASRGLPVYTEGLRLLVDGLTLFPESAAARNALERIRRYTDCVDWAATTVTFRGQDPDRPDLTPQLGMPESTAGMVFLQNLRLADLVRAGFLAPRTAVQLQGTDVEGVLTPDGKLRLDTGHTYSDPDAAAAEILTTRAPQLRWEDWTIEGTSKTLAMIADEARSTSIQAKPSDPIERLGLSARTIRELKGAGITRVSDLTRSYYQLGDIDAVGQQNIVEITAALAASDLSPTTSPPDLDTELSNLLGELAAAGRLDDALAATSLLSRATEVDPAVYARSLANLGALLAQAGRPEEALAPVQAAVAAYRQLAQANPATYTPDLARSLTNLSVLWVDLGRREEALAPAQEAVAAYRPLARADPATYSPSLAGWLNNLSGRLAETGRREEALAAAQEALTVYRLLARADPATTPNLAILLNNLSSRLAELGRREEALAPAQEAVAAYRPLARADPATHSPSLAGWLNNLSGRLAETGRREEALAAAQEALTVYRLLARADPATTPNLAILLNNLSDRLAELGRREEALAPAQEAVTVYRQLAQTDSATYTHALAASLNNNLRGRLEEVGRLEEALVAVQEALTVYRPLARADPATTPNLAILLNNLSNLLEEVRQREEALAPAEEAVTVYRQLAQADPGTYNPNLARSLTNLSALWADLGRREEALAAIEEAIGIYRELAATRPDAYGHELEQSLRVAARLEHYEDPSDTS